MRDYIELQEAGLDENERKVYIATLMLGTGTAQEIAKKAGVLRTTAYGVVASLTLKGFLSAILKEGVNHYQAVSPSQLVEKMDRKREKVASIIPDLTTLQQLMSSTPSASFFEGRNGVIAIINDIVSKKDQDVLLIGTGTKFLEFSPGFLATYFRRKKERNIRVKAIVADTPEERGAARKVPDTKVRFIKEFALNGTCYIYHNKVAFVTYDDPDEHGCIIEDPAFHALMSAVFQLLWLKKE